MVALILLMTSLHFDKTSDDKEELAESFDFLGVSVDLSICIAEMIVC